MTIPLCTCKKLRRRIDVGLGLIIFPVCLYSLAYLIVSMVFPGLWAIAIGVALAVYLILVVKNLKDRHKPRCSLRKSFIDLTQHLPTMITSP